MRDALQRWWQWETRYFRRNAGTRAGERTGFAIGAVLALVGIVAAVLVATIR